MKTFQKILAFLLGADQAAMIRLSQALVLDHSRKAKLRNRGEGFTETEIKMLAVLVLGFSSLGLAGAAFWLRERPGVFAFAAISILLITAVAMSIGYIYSMMLSDEGFRVIASWPVNSRTFLAARLCQPLLYCMAATAIACTPAAMVCMAFSGAPILTGLTFLVVGILATAAQFLLITCAFCLFMEFLGPEECGLLALLAFLASTVFGSRYLEQYFETQETINNLAFHQFSNWLPFTWIASLVQVTHGPVDVLPVILGLLTLLVLPYLLFQAVSVLYRVNLSKARTHKIKGQGGFLLPLLKLNSKSPADHAMAVLCLAHGRADWRFRAQLAMVPVLLLGLIGGTLMGDLSPIFANPLNTDQFFHPAIIFIVVIAFPPILALPMLATSKDFGAAWIMKTSPVTRQSFAAAQRHVMRVVFVYPILTISAMGYLYYQAPLLSVAAHLLMMGLIADVMVCGLQHLFSDYPFALPNDDEGFMMKLMPVVMIYEAVSVLVGIMVFHLLYRWWWAWLVGALLLGVMRYSFIKSSPFSQQPKAPETPQSQEPEIKIDPRVPTLVSAIRDGRYHTVSALLKPDLLSELDQNGKSVGEWLQESDNEQIRGLLE